MFIQIADCLWHYLHVLYKVTNALLYLFQTKKGLSAVWDSIAQGKLLYGKVTMWSQPKEHEADRKEFDHYESEVKTQTTTKIECRSSTF